MDLTLKTRFTAAVLSALAACLAGGCGEQAHSGSYLVVVKDLSSGKLLEGASVELVPLAGDPVTGSTDNHGESILLMGAWPRAELRVGFDGDTDRYYVRTTRVPSWEASADETGSGEKGVLRFIAGSGSASDPRFDVHFMRLKEGLR